jgi:hypothetical protein
VTVSDALFFVFLFCLFFLALGGGASALCYSL